MLKGARQQWQGTGWVRKTTTILILMSLLAVVGLLLIVQDEAAAPLESPVPERDTGAPFISQSQEKLSRLEVEAKIGTYVALLTWAELTKEASEGLRPDFFRLMMTDPNINCAIQYRRYVERMTEATEKPDPRLDYLMTCADGDPRAVTRTTLEAWQTMKDEEKLARAKQRLDLLWQSITPEWRVSAMIAHGMAVEVNRRNNTEFLAFAAEYDICQETIGIRIGQLAGSSTEEGLGSVWSASADEMMTCANATTEGHFPLPPGPPKSEGELPPELELP